MTAMDQTMIDAETSFVIQRVEVPSGQSPSPAGR